MVRLVDIERELFQYVFFNENETTIFGIIKWQKFCRNIQTNWKMNEFFKIRTKLAKQISK